MSKKYLNYMCMLCVLLGIGGCVGGAALGNEAISNGGSAAWLCLLALGFFFS